MRHGFRAGAAAWARFGGWWRGFFAMKHDFPAQPRPSPRPQDGESRTVVFGVRLHVRNMDVIFRRCAGWRAGRVDGREIVGNGGEVRRSNRRKPLEFQRFRVAGRTSPGGCATPGGFRLRQKESAECPVFGHNSSQNAMPPGTQAFPRPSRCSSHLGTKNTPSYVHALPATENVKTLCA